LFFKDLKPVVVDSGSHPTRVGVSVSIFREDFRFQAIFEEGREGVILQVGVSVSIFREDFRFQAIDGGDGAVGNLMKMTTRGFCP